MNKEPIRNDNRDPLDELIESYRRPEMELRITIYVAIYNRLRKLFEEKGKTITRDTELRTLFKQNFKEADWQELNKIGLKIPMLQISKLYDRIMLAYSFLAIIGIVTIAVKNYELIVVLWGLPVLGVITVMVSLPAVLLFFLFKRRHFPCDTVDELIDTIIAINWADLMLDKKLLNEILKNENQAE